MKEKKGIRDLYDDDKIKGFWIWTWGDGWVGPYFDNELWINLNEFVIRDFVLNPEQNEEEIFMKYAVNHLKLSDADAEKLRELCLLSTDAVYYGQASQYLNVNTWWIRDQYLTAINLDQVVRKGLQEKILAEKHENLKIWKRMEQIAYEIQMDNPEDQSFLQVSTTYGRIKYEIIDLIWQMQIMLAENEAGQKLDKEMIKATMVAYDDKWAEWTFLKKQNPNCPTLYEDYRSVYCGPPFQVSLDILKALINE